MVVAVRSNWPKYQLKLKVSSFFSKYSNNKINSYATSNCQYRKKLAINQVFSKL